MSETNSIYFKQKEEELFKEKEEFLRLWEEKFEKFKQQNDKFATPYVDLYNGCVAILNNMWKKTLQPKKKVPTCENVPHQRWFSVQKEENRACSES